MIGLTSIQESSRASFTGSISTVGQGERAREREREREGEGEGEGERERERELRVVRGAGCGQDWSRLG